MVKLIEEQGVTIFWNQATLFIVHTKERGYFATFHARTRGSVERATMIAEDRVWNYISCN